MTFPTTSQMPNQKAEAVPSASLKVQRPTQKTIFRVQCRSSFTMWAPTVGFEAQAHYGFKYSEWVTADMFHRHLNWGNKSPPLSPFISVYDNYSKFLCDLSTMMQCLLIVKAEDAQKRAAYLTHNNEQVVQIAKISTADFMPMSLDIERPDGSIMHLPAWQDEKHATIFITTADIRHYLGVDTGCSHLNEWFAIDFIPYALIIGLETHN